MSARRHDISLAVFLVLTPLVSAPAGVAGPVGPQFQCGDIANPRPTITAGDALAVLRTAVGLESHSLCEADADGNGSIAASDALRTLRLAVGQSVAMNCPFCCALCECTPQQLELTLEDVEVCDGCIPRTPAAGEFSDSVVIDFAGDVNAGYDLDAVAECVWEATVPGAIAEKLLYGNDITDCMGTPQTFTGYDVSIRVVRTADGWEAYAGQYAVSLGWGDVARASLKSSSCEMGGSAASDNETCHLAGVGSETDYDTHATGGQVELVPTDPAPVCP
jgi:hypothetical protein